MAALAVATLAAAIAAPLRTATATAATRTDTDTRTPVLAATRAAALAARGGGLGRAYSQPAAACRWPPRAAPPPRHRARCVRLLRPRLRALRMAWLRRRLGNAVHVVLDDLDNEG